MWLQQRLKGLPMLLSSSWARRMLACLGILLIFYWYLSSEGGFRLFPGAADPRTVTDGCLQVETQRWKSAIDHGNALMSHIDGGSLGQLSGPAVVGNGHLVVDAFSNQLWVASSPASGLAAVHLTDYIPLVSLTPLGIRSASRAALIHFQEGVVSLLQCIQVGSSHTTHECVTLREDVIVHRSRPHLILQRIHISNPTDRVTVFEVNKSPVIGNKFSSSLEKQNNQEFFLLAGRALTEERETILVVVATEKVATRLQVAAKSEFTEHVVSVVYTLVLKDLTDVEESFSKLRKAAKAEMSELLKLGAEELYQEHRKVWGDLINSGVEMKKIMDAHTPSSVIVNKTLFYVLSTSPAPLLDPQNGAEEREKLEASLNYADHCFTGHATMHAENLWPARIADVAHLLQLSNLWRLTLQKRGCKTLVGAGAHGMMQGMVMSFGGLQFTENHLQFQADPSVLHNSYLLRGIHYNKDLINLAVLLDGDEKPFLHVSVKPQEKQVKLYGCEAGCMNDPVELTAELKGHTFPVMVTRPITPLLYISTDLTHLQALRHTLHLKAILAHEDHMAEQYPGLPFLFWFSVASLITLFHLFLFKLIYNEYCGPGAKPIFRSKV
ncbi:uncharacterized protein KIAA2013 homolog [Leucoraja erinacea]|uniref:uncharacterized protein KIAA2013 homolog n=1 Tax=Leucoraja erinaceus TaxID=7782 RepID=UPI002453B406|nr:uncharacterized protein KIAA2013 homolog [Leucoraja erinacea]